MPRRGVINSTVEVIVLEADKHLGERYEVVRVKPIYAKNVLLPQERVVLATPENLNVYKQKMELAEKQRAAKAEKFANLLDTINNDGGLLFKKKANEKGVLYSKLDAKEIAKEINKKYDIKIDEHLLKLKKKLSQAGEYQVSFVYKDIQREINVTVKADVQKKVVKLDNMGANVPDKPEEEDTRKNQTNETKAENTEKKTDENKTETDS